VKFKWKDRARGVQSYDANAVGKQLARLLKKCGALTPETLADEAYEHPNSPLGKCGYEWDVQAAAEAHWRSHSSYILRSIVYLPEEDDDEEAQEYAEVRAFLAVEEDVDEDVDPDEPISVVYYDTKESLEIPSRRKNILARAKAELRAFRKKHKKLNELAAVFTAIDSMSD